MAEHVDLTTNNEVVSKVCLEVLKALPECAPQELIHSYILLIGVMLEKIECLHCRELVAAECKQEMVMVTDCVMKWRGGIANLSTRVDTLDLSTRIKKCLAELNLGTLNDLVQITAGELMRTPNFGLVSLNELKKVLGRLGLSLASKKLNSQPDPFRATMIDLVEYRRNRKL